MISILTRITFNGCICLTISFIFNFKTVFKILLNYVTIRTFLTFINRWINLTIIYCESSRRTGQSTKIKLGFADWTSTFHLIECTIVNFNFIWYINTLISNIIKIIAWHTLKTFTILRVYITICDSIFKTWIILQNISLFSVTK